jgi:hypothetical protein
VDAAPYLEQIGRALQAAALDAVLIGNAAAALHGAPVTTLDFDFLFRRTTRNLQKLKVFARTLEAVVLRPYYPVSQMFRVVRDDGLQVDFMATVHGLRSFEGVRARASDVAVGTTTLRVAALADVLRSKRAAGRPRDLAVIEVLERTDEARRVREKAVAPSSPRAARTRKRSRAR